MVTSVSYLSVVIPWLNNSFYGEARHCCEVRTEVGGGADESKQNLGAPVFSLFIKRTDTGGNTGIQIPDKELIIRLKTVHNPLHSGVGTDQGEGLKGELLFFRERFFMKTERISIEIVTEEITEGVLAAVAGNVPEKGFMLAHIGVQHIGPFFPAPELRHFPEKSFRLFLIDPGDYGIFVREGPVKGRAGNTGLVDQVLCAECFQRGRIQQFHAGLHNPLPDGRFSHNHASRPSAGSGTGCSAIMENQRVLDRKTVNRF